MNIPGTGRGLPFAGARVAQAMLTRPAVHGPATTVAQMRDLFEDEHVHAALIVDGTHLLAVVERSDLAGSPAADAPAGTLGRLSGRTVRPDADLYATWRSMTGERRRRLAVLDEDGGLLGLLCLKSSGRGFCSDADIRGRACARGPEPDPDGRRAGYENAGPPERTAPHSVC